MTRDQAEQMMWNPHQQQHQQVQQHQQPHQQHQQQLHFVMMPVDQCIMQNYGLQGDAAGMQQLVPNEAMCQQMWWPTQQPMYQAQEQMPPVYQQDTGLVQQQLPVFQPAAKATQGGWSMAMPPSQAFAMPTQMQVPAEYAQQMVKAPETPEHPVPDASVDEPASRLEVPAADASCGGTAFPTPRSTEVPPEYSDDGEVEKEDQRKRLSASAARRQRRKRAAERAQQGGGADFALPGTIYPEHCDQLREQLQRGSGDVQGIVRRLRGQVLLLSRDAQGCRLVQQVLEMAVQRDAAAVAKELEGHVLEAVMCPHGNYVVQKVVAQLSVASSDFVAREIQGSVVRVAKHRFACRILCRLLEFSGSNALTAELVEELLSEAGLLCCHSFAHHVIQSVLEHGLERHKEKIAQALLEDPKKFAMHKNSSYLIEKALCYCSPNDQNGLIASLGSPTTLVELAYSPYGCYVAKALLSLEDGRVDNAETMNALWEHRNELGKTRHGQKLLQEFGLVETAA